MVRNMILKSIFFINLLFSELIFSHSQVAKKNLLVTLLVDHMWSNEPGLTDELAATLSELTSLNRAEHSRVKQTFNEFK